MDMCVQNFIKFLILLAVLVFLGGCGAMDAILPSTGTYRVNARINDLPLDELPFVSSSAKIQPYFDEAVSGDPDVTALMIFLKNSGGEIAGWKVIYIPDVDSDTNQEPPVEPEQDYFPADQDERDEQEYVPDEVSYSDDENLNEDENEGENEGEGEDEVNDSDEDAVGDTETVAAETPQDTKFYKNGDEFIITVKSLDDDLPFFPIPPDLPMGRYTFVSNVMNGNQVLDKTEITFFFLADVNFSFEGIHVHQGGITESSQLINKGTVIMLEAKLDFDSRLNPYIVWYNGKKIIGEGSFSEGAGNLLWKAPDQSGFFSIRAETFPIVDRQGLAGYVKDISLLVSSKKTDMHFLSEDTPNLLRWYTFEGNLSDSKMKTPERALKPAGNISPRWVPASGIYGLVTGPNDVYSLPKVSFSNNGNDSWRILFRFKPLKDGVILSVHFGPSFDVALNLSAEGKNLILTLASPLETVSETFDLSEGEASDPPETDPFIIAGVNFSVLPDRLLAKLNVIRDFIDEGEPETEPISLEAELDKEYEIILGSKLKNNTPALETGNTAAKVVKPAVFTALWDELALFYMPFTEVETVKDEEPQEEAAAAEAEELEAPTETQAPAEAEVELDMEEQPVSDDASVLEN